MTPTPPLQLFVAGLQRHTMLPDAAATALLALQGPVRTLEPSSYIIREGDAPRECLVLLSGYAYRQKLTCDGARQIVGLRIPGDPLDLQSLYLDAADHNVQALTRCEVMSIPRVALEQLVANTPILARAVIVNILIEASIAREWLLNIGRRNARGRLAHLLCEFAYRLDAQGLADGGGYELPMTQEQLGDALGLTSVHINRTLKVLEAEGVLFRRGRHVRFEDRKRMERIADFSALYLHAGTQANGQG